MNLPYILILIILLLVCYIVYRLMSDKIQHMELNKGGFIKGETKIPDFTRDDVKIFLAECNKYGIEEALAKEFFISVYNTLSWISEPNAPKFTDNRYDLWGLDDDIDDVINYIFEQHNISPIKWNDREILNLVYFKDILVYLQEKINNN